MLMDGAALPAPFRAFPLPLFAAAPRSECSDSSRKAPLLSPFPQKESFSDCGWR